VQELKDHASEVSTKKSQARSENVFVRGHICGLRIEERGQMLQIRGQRLVVRGQRSKVRGECLDPSDPGSNRIPEPDSTDISRDVSPLVSVTKRRFMSWFHPSQS